MMQAIRGSAFVAVVILTAAVSASAAERCTKDTLTIEGTSVAASICAAGPSTGAQRLAVTETLVSGTGTLTHTTDFELLPAGVSRAVDDISLERLGFKRTLHVTLAHRNGVVTLEHALLLPGAVPIK